MKKIIFALIFLIFQQNFSTELFNAQLNENEKLEVSSSIVLGERDSKIITIGYETIH
jgi:hypothetical protein